MSKVFISPSNQIGNVYAIGNTNEKAQMTILADMLGAALTRCGIEVIRNDVIKPDQRPTYANAQGCVCFFALHSNGYNKTVRGARTFYLDTYAIYEKKYVDGSRWLTQCIAEEIKKLNMIPAPLMYKDFQNWFEIRVPAMSSTYLEAFFHDSIADCTWFFANKEKYAEALAYGICRAYSFAYVAPATAQPIPVLTPIQMLQVKFNELQAIYSTLKEKTAPIIAENKALADKIAQLNEQNSVLSSKNKAIISDIQALITKYTQ